MTKPCMHITNIINISVISVIIIFILLYYRIKNLDIQMKDYPPWIDKQFHPILHKKVDGISLPYKMAEILYCKNNYMNWESLQIVLDLLIDKIKATHIKFDAIVGIKTGGAILTKYIANKLNITEFYYVKVSDKYYNCKKTQNDIFHFLLKSLSNYKPNYMVCDPINANIAHKNILLFDELIYKGNTMSSSINYLLNEKNVNFVLPVTIYSKYKKYDDFIPLYLIEGQYQKLWPWGYDN